MTKEELLKAYAELRAEQDQKKAEHAGTCPSCGHCPHCGRGGYQAIPYYPQPYVAPYPYQPYQPWWSGPHITWTSGGTLPQSSDTLLWKSQ